MKQLTELIFSNKNSNSVTCYVRYGNFTLHYDIHYI